MKTELFYCESCQTEIETNIVLKTEKCLIRDEEIECELKIRVCKKCGCEVWDRDLDDENCKMEYDAYKRKKGLLTSAEIKLIRKKCRLNQVDFAKLLRLGAKTIARYEAGAIQEPSIDSLIRLAENPENRVKLNSYILGNKCILFQSYFNCYNNFACAI